MAGGHLGPRRRTTRRPSPPRVVDDPVRLQLRPEPACVDGQLILVQCWNGAAVAALRTDRHGSSTRIPWQHLVARLERIISGGQTGADRAALDVALERGLEVGGWVPYGRVAEDGRIPDGYPGLVETDSRDPAVRTMRNVRDLDATLIVSHGPLTGRRVPAHPRGGAATGQAGAPPRSADPLIGVSGGGAPGVAGRRGSSHSQCGRPPRQRRPNGLHGRGHTAPLGTAHCLITCWCAPRDR